MDADTFSAFAHSELQQHLHAGGQRSHGMTLSNSHSVSSNRAQQPLPLVLPQLHHLPLSTALAAPAAPPTPTSAGLVGHHQQQIQIPPASESQTPDTANSADSSGPQTQIQIQAHMEAGVLPTAEDKARYDAARKELIQALQKKRVVDRTLAQLEVQIYNFEGSYLTETATHSGGNIIQGFDSYMKTQGTSRRRHEVTDADRVFSNSSLTYQKSLELVGDSDDPQPNGHFGAAGGMDEGSLSAHSLSLSASTGGRGLTPGLTTVVLPPPQTRGPSENTPMTAAQQKKARDKEYQRRKRANAAQLRSQQQAAAAAAAAIHREASVRETSTDGGGDENGSIVSGRGSSRRPNKRPRPADDD